MDRPSLDARRSGRSSISSGGSGGGGGGGPVYSGCFAGKLTPTLGRRCVRLLSMDCRVRSTSLAFPPHQLLLLPAAVERQRRPSVDGVT